MNDLRACEFDAPEWVPELTTWLVLNGFDAQSRVDTTPARDRSVTFER